MIYLNKINYEIFSLCNKYMRIKIINYLSIDIELKVKGILEKYKSR